MSHSTISPQFDSDERAQIILKEALQGNFILRELKPDFFLDYHAERRVNNEPSGATVFIQLKGQKELQQSDGLGKVQLEAKALRYYDGTVTDPVFVVLVDIANRRGYYLFAQDWIDRQRATLDLNKDGRITVSVPLQNDLSNIPKFILDCENARSYMRNKYPGTPEAALANYAKNFAGLDPRFTVQAFLTPAGRILNISAKQPTDVQFKVLSSGQDAARQFSEAFEYGKPIGLSHVLLKAEGSPLFEKLLDGATPVKIEWKPSASINCFFELSCADSGSRFTLSLPLQLTRGNRGISFKTTADDCPILFEGTIDAPNQPKSKRGAGLTFHTATWIGKPIMALPWFEGVMGFVKATNDQAEICVALVHKGNKILDSALSPTWEKGTELDIVRWFEFVRIVRALAEAAAVNKALPDFANLTKEEIHSIAAAHDLLTTGKLLTNGFSFSINRKNNDKFWNDVVSSLRTRGESDGKFRLSTAHKFNFLGAEESLGELRIEEFEARVRPASGANVMSEEEIEVEVTDAAGGDVVFSLVRANERG